ncbi:SDR family oxidoreductase [Cryptosporangium arvum]|uniref:SDR family oxidoreductase n=1 Tax=Cryptosporangium arvum TaxID=80871 RepID=UPI0004B2ABDD|nr:SDR family oxidoreductase [Cryptosporangium arvum]
MTTSKIILVTGASSGIGAAVVRRLAADGHHVVAAARRTDRLDALAASSTGSVEVAGLDVADRAAVTALVERVRARHGRLDVLVANAGVMLLSRLDAGLVDEWDRMLDVNVRGLLNGIAAALPAFRDQGAGHLVSIASVGAHEVVPTSAVYSATKHAVWAITEGLRQEADPGLRVSTISPGVVESELAEHITDPHARDAMRTYRAASIPPEAIAATVAFAIDQPGDVDVNEVIVRPTRQRP